MAAYHLVSIANYRTQEKGKKIRGKYSWLMEESYVVFFNNEKL